MSDTTDVTETPKAPEAPRRRPNLLTVPSRRLEGPSIPGFHLAWINDDGRNLQLALESGYMFVREATEKPEPTNRSKRGADMNQWISRYVGTRESGEPMRAFLMALPEELWQDALRESDARSDKLREALTRSKVPDSVGADRQNFFRF